MTLLHNHTSPETAYVVDDYPYGFRLRCKKRYWLEFTPKRGFRFLSQTTNPKVSGEVWNKPKASTYCRFGGAMYLDEQGHVQWAGSHEYSDLGETREFIAKYGEAVPEAGKHAMEGWHKARELYELQCQRGEVKIRITTNGVDGEWEKVAPQFPKVEAAQ